MFVNARLRELTDRVVLVDFSIVRRLWDWHY